MNFSSDFIAHCQLGEHSLYTAKFRSNMAKRWPNSSKRDTLRWHALLCVKLLSAPVNAFYFCISSAPHH